MAVAARVASAPAARDRLTYATILSYGSIQFASQALFTLNAVHLLFFYTDVGKLNAALAGLVLAIGNVVDAITNPIMGQLSDAVRWRAGRRRPFYIPACTATAVVWALLFMPPARLDGTGLFLWMLACYVSYTLTRTAYYIPWVAQAPDLTQQYDERSRLAAFRIFMGVPGDILGGFLPLGLAAVLGSQRAGFRAGASIVGVLIFLAGLLAYFGTYERPPERTSGARRRFRVLLRALLPHGRPPRTGSPVGLVRWAAGPFFDEIVAPIWSVPSATVFAASLAGTIGLTVPIATFRYVTKYYFNDPGLDTWVMGLYFAGALSAAPGWLWLCRRFDKKRAYMGAMLLYLLVASPVPWCGRDDAHIFLACMVGIGFAGTGLVLVPAAFSPDVIEWNRLHKGEGYEGRFYGIWGFLLPCGQALSLFVVGTVLDLTGFVPDAAQPAAVLRALLGMFIGFPAVALLTAAAIFSRYPITREVYEDIERRLAAQREAARDATDSPPRA